MKAILITGINGFLGSHIAKKLTNKYEIIGVEYSIENLWRLDGTSFEVYTSDDVSLEKIFKNYTIFAVIHAATIYRKLDDSIIDIINTNVVFPVKLYELANKYNVSTFLNTDSFFNDKKYQYSYLFEYTQSKNDALKWLKQLNLRATCKLVNMKIFHMYGPGDALTKFIPSMLSKIKVNTPSEGHKYSKLVRPSSTNAKKRQSLNTEKDNDNSDTMVPENKSQNKKRKKYPLIMQIDGESIDLGSFATLGELKERRRVFIESIKDDD